MKNLIVNDKFNDKDLISFLKKEFPNLSQSIIYKALRKKDIRINNVKISNNIKLHEGDNVTLYILDKFLYGEFFKLDIIYEDDNILAINKPKGVEVVRKKFFDRNN